MTAGCTPFVVKCLEKLAALLPFCALLLLPALGTLVPGPISWNTITVYDWERIGLVVFLVSCLLVSAATRLCGGTIDRGDVLSFVILSWGLLSATANGVVWADAIHDVAMLAALVASATVIVRGLERWGSAEWHRPVLLCLSGSAFLYLVIFFQDNADNLFTPMYMGDGVLFPVFSNVRFFSDYQVLLIPFLIYLIPLGRLTAKALPVWLLASLFCMLCFFNNTRALLLGQLVAHGSLLLVSRLSYLSTLRRHASVWGLGYLLYLLLSTFVPTVLQARPASVQPILRADVSTRLELWSHAAGYIFDHPWFGIGPGEFARNVNGDSAAPHNSLLMIAAEWGIPAMGLALYLLLAHSSRFMGAQNSQPYGRSNSALAVPAWLALSALVVHSLVANVLVVPSSQLSLLLAASLSIASMRAAALSDEGRISIRPASSLVATWQVLIAIVIAWVVAHDLPSLPQRNQEYLDCQKPTPYFSPRFWQQGWLVAGCEK